MFARFLQRPVLAIVLSVVVVFVGLLSIKTLPISQFPNIAPPRVMINLSFPGAIKQALTQWRVGFPAAIIDGRVMDVVQGATAGKSRVKLFFDKESGLLVRLVRYADTVVGIVPTQIDYSDYRVVSGVKMPFKWTVTWTDGRSTVANQTRSATH